MTAILMLAFALAASAQPKSVRMDGSSTVYPIAEAVAEEFQTEKRATVRVTVGISGTGGGFKKFCRGETDLQNASRPIQASEMSACKAAGVRYYELPIAFDAAVVVVNKTNNFLNQITIAELRKIWEPAAQGKIKSWKDVRSEWPDAPLHLYGAGADSGTFDYFTEAVTGKAKASRGDYTASEDDNVLVKGVSSDRYALGYLPLAYYQENQSSLKAVPVVPAKSKTAVLPSRQTVENGTYTPLSRPLFVYVSAKSYERPEIKEFVSYYLSKAPELVAEAKYVPLPIEVYQLAREQVEKGRVGTAFGGHSPIGVQVRELLQRKKKL